MVAVGVQIRAIKANHMNELKPHRLETPSSRVMARRVEGSGELPEAAEWAPVVDISEDDTEYLIQAELPEVKRADVRVTADVGTLTIMGERRFEPAAKGRKYHQVERAYGSFGRSFALPDDADPENICAELKDGVLTVHLVKDVKAKPPQIEVKIS
jgi:HSP20 family protein